MSSERSGTVLVVEDDPAMRDLLTEELSDAGFTVEAAPTAAAGLELARVTRFDLIITDLRMPEMDGFDLIRGVMQLHEPPHVVMITAFASIETAIRAVKLGAYDYIAKPFEIEELLLVADKALGERALRNKVARLQREVGRWHDLPGRDRRAGAAAPGQAAARPPGARGPPARCHPQPAGRRPRRRGDQPQPRDHARRRQLPRGPLLPAQRHPPRSPAP